MERHARNCGCLTLGIIEVNGSGRGPLGNLTQSKVNTAWLLLLGDMSHVSHKLASDDFESAENHCEASSFSDTLEI